MDWSGPQVAIASGLVVGAVLGVTVQRSNFCMMGAVADFAVSGDLRRMRAWLLAIAVAILSTQALAALSAIDLDATFYLSPRVPILTLVPGGLMFGFGMVIACGCTSRNLVNAAMGDLRAVITLLVMAVVAYATLRGVLAYPRLWLTELASLDVAAAGAHGQGVHHLIPPGGDPGTGTTLTTASIIAAALAAFALRDPMFRAERRYLVAALLIGLCVATGWLATGVLARDEFEPVPLESLRFVAPVGESLVYLMTFTGARADFGVASVAGVLVGAWASAVAGGSFRWRAFEDLHDLSRYTVGGALMGFGGVLSLGCTVGQGLTGVSTLSIGSFLALASIITGGILGVRYLESGSVIGAFRAAIGRA